MSTPVLQPTTPQSLPKLSSTHIIISALKEKNNMIEELKRERGEELDALKITHGEELAKWEEWRKEKEHKCALINAENSDIYNEYVAEKKMLNEENARLKEENARLMEENARLKEQTARLEAIKS